MSTENIWQEFSDQLYGFIIKRVNDRETARDILQDIFLKIHTKKDSLTHSDRLTSWIFQLTRNAIIDHYRQAKSTVDITGFDELIANEEPNRDILVELTCCIEPFTNHLSKHEKKLIHLADLQGSKQKDIASDLNLPYTTLKSQLQRTRKKLKNMLLSCCDSGFSKSNITEVNFSAGKCSDC